MPGTDSPRKRFGFRLVVLARRWRRHLDAGLAAAGLSDATWGPLVHLQAAKEGLYQKDLAVRVGVDGSSLVRLLDILETQGLIARLADDQDRRAKRVVLTEAGREVVKDLRVHLTRMDAELMEGISDDDIDAAMRVFDLIESRLEAAKQKRED